MMVWILQDVRQFYTSIETISCRRFEQHLDDERIAEVAVHLDRIACRKAGMGGLMSVSKSHSKIYMEMSH